MNEDTPPESSEERKEQLELEAILEKANQTLVDVNAKSEAISTIHSEASTIHSDLDEKNAEITSTIEAINKSTTSAQDSLTESENISASLKKDQADAEKTKSEIDAFHGGIKELYNLLLTDTKGEEDQDVDTQDEEDQEAKLSIKSQILETQEQIEKINSQAESDFSKLKDTLEKEIRSLLPEAGSAGLSSTYFQAKERYGPIPYDKKVHGSGRGARFWHFIENRWRNGLINYIAFIAPLVLLFVYFTLNPLEKDVDFSTILIRFFISAPLATISLFGWSSIRLQRRLYEEYNHKQRVMQLYVSFADEVEKVGTEAHKKELLTIMLRTVADKPTLAMNDKDKSFKDTLSQALPSKGKPDNTKNNEPSS